MRFFENVRKRRAIKRYAQKLPRLLVKDYGRRTQYSPPQIRSTVDRYNMNAIYSCYAIAMFSNREAFDQFHEANGEQCNYDAMRSEIATEHFGGNSGFGLSDILTVFPEGDSGHDHGSSHDGGGGDGHSGH